jgi:hypothetical protein
LFRLGDWEFCRKLDGCDRETILPLQDRFHARGWIQHSKKDAHSMQAIRSVLSQERLGWDLSRMSDDRVLDQLSNQLVSGRVHIHAFPVKETPAGPQTPKEDLPLPGRRVATASDDAARDAKKVSPVGPVITIHNPIVVVKRPYTNPKRQPVVLSVDDASFDGSGTLTISGAAITFFDHAINGSRVSNGATFTGAQLDSSVTIFAEGTNPSAAMSDVQLTLTLKPGSQPVKPPAHGTMTAVRVTLDICKSRTSKTADPALVADKISQGRFLQVQHSDLCGRAMMIVRKAEPAAFPGNLVLIPLNGKARAFAASDEIPAAQSPLPARHLIANPGIDKAHGEKRWAEAAAVSTPALRDTGFQLGVDGVDDDGDRVNITAVEFTKIVATIKSTPPLHGARAGFALPADYTFTTTSLSPNFAVNAPLVMMKNAQPDVKFEVTSSPAGIPVRWQAIRNSKDHATLGGAAAVPAVATLTGSSTKVNMNASGSFRVRAYIDCNGSNKYEDEIDLEPSIPLNLMLANATMVTDNSAASTGFLSATGGAAGEVGIHNGEWNAGQGGMSMSLVAKVTGGGEHGKTGLDQVFAGLINNLALVNIGAVYRDSSVTPHVDHSLVIRYVSNASAATGHFRGRKMFQPGDPAPAPLAWPILDTGRAPNSGTGGDMATMGSSALAVDDTPAVGQLWTITCMDAPQRGFHKNHPVVASAVLRSIQYSQDFTANFCFWTNTTKNSGATGDPVDRLYSVLRKVAWRVAGAWSISYPAATPNTATITVVTAHTATTPSRATFDLGRAEDHQVEVRPPSGIAQVMVWDASS